MLHIFFRTYTARTYQGILSCSVMWGVSKLDQLGTEKGDSLPNHSVFWPNLLRRVWTGTSFYRSLRSPIAFAHNSFISSAPSSREQPFLPILSASFRKCVRHSTEVAFSPKRTEAAYACRHFLIHRFHNETCSPHWACGQHNRCNYCSSYCRLCASRYLA